VASAHGGFKGTGSITIYPAGSHGDATPIATITGTHTGLVQPYRIAVDSSGRIYALDSGGLKIYAPASNGDVAPIATLANLDAKTRLDETRAIALDSQDKIYVASARGRFMQTGDITVYPAGSHGDATPVATITSATIGLVPQNIAVDSGGRIYAIANGEVVVYAPGSNGEVKPVASIISKNAELDHSPHGVAVGPDGKVYVANGGNLKVYPHGADGDVPPAATIAGEKTGLNVPQSIVADLDGNIYVVNGLAKPVTLTVYSEAALARGGDVPPIATIGGPHSGLDSSTNIAVDSGRRIYATTQSPDSVRIFAQIVTVTSRRLLSLLALGPSSIHRMPLLSVPAEISMSKMSAPVLILKVVLPSIGPAVLVT
jgi:hypothetical protein